MSSLWILGNFPSTSTVWRESICFIFFFARRGVWDHVFWSSFPIPYSSQIHFWFSTHPSLSLVFYSHQVKFMLSTDSWLLDHPLEDEAILLKKINSPFPSSYQLPIARLIKVGLLLASLLHSEIWYGVSLHRSRSCCHHYCKFLSAAAPLCWKDPTVAIHWLQILDSFCSPFYGDSWAFRGVCIIWALHLRLRIVHPLICVLSVGLC